MSSINESMAPVSITMSENSSDDEKFSSVYDKFPRMEPGCGKSMQDTIGFRGSALLWDLQREAYYNGEYGRCIGYSCLSRGQQCASTFVYVIPSTLLMGTFLTLGTLACAVSGSLCGACCALKCCVTKAATKNKETAVKCCNLSAKYGIATGITCGIGLLRVVTIPCSFACPELSAMAKQHELNAAISRKTLELEKDFVDSQSEIFNSEY